MKENVTLFRLFKFFKAAGYSNTRAHRAAHYATHCYHRVHWENPDEFAAYILEVGLIGTDNT